MRKLHMMYEKMVNQRQYLQQVFEAGWKPEKVVQNWEQAMMILLPQWKKQEQWKWQRNQFTGYQTHTIN